jgi:hypothetical protein
MNQYRCDLSCKYFDDSDEENKVFDLIYCKKIKGDIEPTFREVSKEVGCASHSDFKSERDKFLKRMLECISQYEMLPNGMDFVIEDLLAELRQAGEP